MAVGTLVFISYDDWHAARGTWLSDVQNHYREHR